MTETLATQYPTKRLQLTMDAGDAWVLNDALGNAMCLSLANKLGINHPLYDAALTLYATAHQLLPILVPDHAERLQRLAKIVNEWMGDL